uniref:VWFC domain-containing protein n=1 Tax=Branchiostoma floridae TaxID=7739 RepID=C3YAI0_BRAFL|eukprot:XP_002606718.1 hypothetical protein BRAFLDRAFT_82358 [Branchiostoma floridae]
MLPALFFPLVFLLTSGAEGRSLTGCLFSDGQVYPPGEFSPDRCTRCTCMTTQLSAGRNTYLPVCERTCDPDAKHTTTTIPTTVLLPSTPRPTTTTIYILTTTTWPPCQWICHKPCVDATPDSPCSCGHCPNGINILVD